MPRLVPLAVLFASLTIASTCPAPVLDSDHLIIDFTKEKDAYSQASWPKAEGINFNEQGFGSDKKDPTSWWIETRPLAIGLSVRPASGANVTVTITPPPVENGSDAGGVFVRYSPDYKHWSSWQPLSREESDSGAAVFKGELTVPDRESAKYDQYREKYQLAHINSDADEEAVVRWILKQEPKFFDHSIPFIGYVEFLFESPRFETYRIKRLEGEIQWGVGGLGLSVDSDLKTRWRFKAQ